MECASGQVFTIRKRRRYLRAENRILVVKLLLFQLSKLGGVVNRDFESTPVRYFGCRIGTRSEAGSTRDSEA
jgi:hypothetical protein